MSDNMRGERSFGILDKMTTEELEDLMRQMPLDDINTDYWNAVMDAYMRRADTQKSDVEAALNDFKDKYSGYKPVFSENSEAPRKTQISQQAISKTGHRSFYHIGLVAAVAAVVLIAGTVTAYAFGYDLWGAVATWTKETFSFIVDGSKENEVSASTTPEPRLYGLYQALDDAGITQEVIPNWLPDGYEVKSLEATSEPLRLFAVYCKDSNNILIQINRVDPSNSITFEKDAVDVEEYVVNDITHYLISNNDQTRAAWVNADLECSISGDISEDELKKMINSIYGELD